VLQLICLPLLATTWYVRPDGGTRYSTNAKNGQCDGQEDAPYPGSGTNRHCAFNDVRLLWQDGSWVASGSPFPAWGWVIKGGDTVILRGSIGTGVSYRVGWSNPSSCIDSKVSTKQTQARGVCGDPYGSGMPPPPSGTPEHHTRILGENYQSCHAASAKTQLHGGFGVFGVVNMGGSSFVDLACLDITDFSSCGRMGQKNGCNTNTGSLTDFATNGIVWNSSSTNDSVKDVRVHGLASAGMLGPTGDGVVMDHIDVIGNASSGWNTDLGNKTTGTGRLLVTNYNISWNGCAEEYPLVHPLPYGDCTDDNSGGYGDGFGTATVSSDPGWQVHFDQGVVSNNTQDGLDALHITGPGSSMTVTRTLAYGNMGQQVKIGGSKGTLQHNVIFTNCNALRQKVPGTPEGYNERLSDFCRAADTGLVFTVGDGSTTTFTDNVIYSASRTGIEVDVNGSCKTSTCLIQQERNVFIGFKNDAANGYPNGGSGEYSNPMYLEEAAKAYANPGSSFDHNTTYHANARWRCPAVGLHEKDAHCGDPHLANESWPIYGHVDVTPTQSAANATSSGTVDGMPAQDKTRPSRAKQVALASLDIAVLGVAGWIGWRRRKAR